MKNIKLRCFVVGLVVVVGFFSVRIIYGQELPNCRAIERQSGSINGLCVVAQFSDAVGENQLRENLYVLSRIKKSRDDVITIRICSNDPLPAALAQAAISPLDVRKQIRFLYGRSMPKLLVLTSPSCNTKGINGLKGTDVLLWSGKSPAPKMINDAFDVNTIDIQPLNFDAGTCRVSDYRRAIRTALEKMKTNPDSTVGITGYYIKGKSKKLIDGMKSAQNIFQRAEINESRLTSVYRPFNGDGNLPCSEKKLDQPVILYISIK